MQIPADEALQVGWKITAAFSQGRLLVVVRVSGPFYPRDIHHV